MEPILQKIEKNGIYAVYGHTKGITDQGMALIVLNMDSEYVEGVGVGIINPKNFKINRDQFINNIEKGTYTFVEILPKFVIKEMKAIFKNNLK